jgi:hypothetical protein
MRAPCRKAGTSDPTPTMQCNHKLTDCDFSKDFCPDAGSHACRRVRQRCGRHAHAHDLADTQCAKAQCHAGSDSFEVACRTANCFLPPDHQQWPLLPAR